MKFKITTLSPINIAGSEDKVLSPYSDYVYNDGFINLIERNKLENYIAGKDISIFEEYIKQIKTSIITKSTSVKNLGDFISNTLNMNFKEFSYKKIYCISNPKNQKIDLFQKTNGKPFIPGSTLKGSIRTAILFNYINSHKNELDIHNKYWESDLLGKGKDDIMKFFQVTDTEPIDEETEIAHCERISISNPNTQAIPKNYEVIPEKINATININSMAKDIHKTVYYKLNNFKFLFKEKEYHVLKILNQFSKQNIYYELQNFIKYNKNNRFELIINFYQKLYDSFNTNNDNYAILRIGKGKTFFDNSISAIFKDDKKKMTEIKKLPNPKNPKRWIGYSIKGKNFVEPFPITRTLIMKNEEPLLPLGWIKIYKI